MPLTTWRDGNDTPWQIQRRGQPDGELLDEIGERAQRGRQLSSAVTVAVGLAFGGSSVSALTLAALDAVQIVLLEISAVGGVVMMVLGVARALVDHQRARLLSDQGILDIAQRNIDEQSDAISRYLDRLEDRMKIGPGSEGDRL